MGLDPAHCVVNEWDRCHDIKNLFIVDGSIWVTSGGVNPTSTIQALALYIADSIKQRLADLFDWAAMNNDDLNPEQVRDLRVLAGTIIPPSSSYGVPGADDEKIFNDILRSLERDRDDVCRALAHLATVSGGAFADLEPVRRTEVAA